ncbi:MAG: nuclear transport factor 2 family protein [Burkholderiales bacterium]
MVHTSQVGKAKTVLYLCAADDVLNTPDFCYVGEWYGEHSAVLEFNATLDGIVMDGVDMIWWNADDRIVRFKVMVRPLKAINLLHQRMGQAPVRPLSSLE